MSWKILGWIEAFWVVLWYLIGILFGATVGVAIDAFMFGFNTMKDIARQSVRVALKDETPTDPMLDDFIDLP